MTRDRQHLRDLLDRLQRLAARNPPPHERPIVEVAHEALVQRIREETTRLQQADYLRADEGDETAAERDDGSRLTPTPHRDAR